MHNQVQLKLNKKGGDYWSMIGTELTHTEKLHVVSCSECQKLWAKRGSGKIEGTKSFWKSEKKHHFESREELNRMLKQDFPDYA